MSLETVREYFRKLGMEDRIHEFSTQIATVAEAAAALGCEEKRIAKTMSFMVNGKAVLIVLAGDAKVDNTKYKAQFGAKAVMLDPDEVMDLVGHPAGGVCPFEVRDGVDVYLDNSLKRFDKIYPAAGSRNSAVGLTLTELERYSGYHGWIDVSKGWEQLC